MPQQINLFSPILLAPRRYFSARAMAQALAVCGVGLALLSAWTVSNTRALQRDLQSASQAHGRERQQLELALARQPAPAPTAALEQELAAERLQLAARQRALAELGRGLATDGQGHSAWLRLLAQTVPAPVWLTDVKLGDGQMVLAGLTLQPEALRPWLARLSAHPLAAGRSFSSVKVERAAATAEGAPDRWTFQVDGSTRPGTGASP